MTELDEMLRKQIENAMDQIVSAIIPVYRFNQKNRPFLDGTAILFKIEKHHFIISAKHVFGDDPTETLISSFGGELFTFGGGVFIPEIKGKMFPEIDTAILEISSDQVLQIEKHRRFLELDDISLSHEPIVDFTYVTTGYPSSQSNSKPGKHIQSKLIEFNCQLAKNEEYLEKGVTKKAYYLYKYAKKRKTIVKHQKKKESVEVVYFI